MLYLSNYAHLQVKDELTRLAGVGAVQVFGAGEYSMRVWLDPNRLASRQLTTTDVVRAIREQNVQVAAGVLGAPPAPSDATFQLVDQHAGTPDDGRRSSAASSSARPTTGQITRLSDVARLELGSSRYSLRSLLDNKPAVAIGVFQRPGTNALQASADVHATMERLKQNFPPGVDYRIVYDPTVFVRESINAVAHTLLEAILLVVIVVVVFLQTWRASIIPLVAVPVSLIGTFAVMLGLGFSLNTLSLFGLVLAIGIVVDDAIVVVENVERHIELGQPPMEATRRAMAEVSGPIIAIALVLGAVFVPTAFISGLTGQFYRQFALTIAISTVISAFNSLTLSPALASRLLRAHGAPRDRAAARRSTGCSAGSSAASTACSRAGRRSTPAASRACCAWRRVALVVYAGLIGLTGRRLRQGAAGLHPGAGQGLPRRVRAAARRRHARSHRAGHPPDVVAGAGASRRRELGGVSRACRSTASSTRRTPASPSSRSSRRTSAPATHGLDANSIVGDLNQRFGAIQDAFVAIFPPPPVQGLGTVGGFKLYVEDRAGLGFEELYTQVQSAAAAGQQEPSLAGLFSSFQVSVPQIDVHVDRERVKTYGIPLTDVFDTLQVYLGSLYANDFNRFGRTYQVNVQAESSFRMQPEQIARLKTRNARGEMVPLGSVLQVSRTYGPDQVMHYNGYPAAEINGGPSPGHSSGQAQDAMAGAARAHAAQRHDLRVDRAGLSGRDLRQHDVPDLSAVRAARLRRAGGAVRELVAAADGDPDRADDAALGHRRRLADRRRQQRVHADQLPGAGRAGLQERDPDRRVRAAARDARARRAAPPSSTPAGSGCGRC